MSILVLVVVVAVQRVPVTIVQVVHVIAMLNRVVSATRAVFVLGHGVMRFVLGLVGHDVFFLDLNAASIGPRNAGVEARM